MDITLSKKVSGDDITYTDSSELEEDIGNVHVTRNGVTENLEHHSSVRVLSECLPYSKSRSHSNSCRIILQGKAKGGGAPRVQYRTSVRENVQAKTKPEYYVQEQHSINKDQLQDTLKSTNKRRSSDMSFSLANVSNRGSLLFSSIVSESNNGDVSSINLGLLRESKMSDASSRSM